MAGTIFKQEINRNLNALNYHLMNSYNNRKKILVLDDEPDFCSLISKILSKEGLEVICAHTLTEGLDLIKSKNPDIVLLDNRLPDGTGIDFLTEHKILFSKTEVIMITADGQPETKKRALTAGAGYCIEKPLDILKIREILSSIAQV